MKEKKKVVTLSLNEELYANIQILAIKLGLKEGRNVSSKELLEEGMKLVLDRYGDPLAQEPLQEIPLNTANERTDYQVNYNNLQEVQSERYNGQNGGPSYPNGYNGIPNQQNNR